MDKCGRNGIVNVETLIFLCVSETIIIACKEKEAERDDSEEGTQNGVGQLNVRNCILCGLNEFVIKFVSFIFELWKVRLKWGDLILFVPN